MFVNVIKNRIVRWVIYAVLGTLCLYNGTSCVAALHKAGKQPYLLSGDVWRYMYSHYRHAHSPCQMEAEKQ
mgnify:CR=1 FL=1